MIKGLPQSQEAALRYALDLRASRKNLDSLFERLSEVFLPNRQGFTSTHVDGDDLNDHLYTSAPVLARRSLASAVSTMLRPSGRVWAHGRTKFVALNQVPEVRLWLEEVTQILFAYLYDPRAKMEINLSMADNDLVTFGNAVVRVGWDAVGGHLKYRTRPLANCYYVVNALGDVVGIVTFEMWTVRQIRERWGDDKLSENMKRALDGSKPNPDAEFELVNIVLPVQDAKLFKMPFKQPYSSLWMSTRCKHTLESRGHDVFPYLTPRWDLTTGETYARSPAMVALGDAELLQAMNESMLEAAEKALNPPLWGFGDSVNGEFDLAPGGYTPVDPASMLSNTPPINAVQLGKMPGEMVEFIQMIEERIGSAFYRDILELPSVRDTELTATEINARLDQYMRQAAPVFSRIEANYNAPHINLVYRLLESRNVLPPKPDIVQHFEGLAREQAIEFDYESPIKVARDKSEAVRIAEGIGTMVQTAALLGPEAVAQLSENLNVDAIARQMGPKLDLPEWVFVPIEQMMQNREARMQQQQQMMMAEMANKAAPALKAAIDGGELLSQNMPQEDGEALPLPSPDMLPFDQVEGLEEVL